MLQNWIGTNNFKPLTLENGQTIPTTIQKGNDGTMYYIDQYGENVYDSNGKLIGKKKDLGLYLDSQSQGTDAQGNSVIMNPNSNSNSKFGFKFGGRLKR